MSISELSSLLKDKAERAGHHQPGDDPTAGRGKERRPLAHRPVFTGRPDQLAPGRKVQAVLHRG